MNWKTRTIFCFLGMLALTLGSCQKYSTGQDCAEFECQRECENDAQCQTGQVCVGSHEGCCSECERVVCVSDADCETCQRCDVAQGVCQGLPCIQECNDEMPCPLSETCIYSEGGCCSRCEYGDPCADMECLTECRMDSDCPFEHTCLTGPLGCCGICMADDPCADLQCAAQCQFDSDCPGDSFCHTDEQGCCGRCEPGDPCDNYNCLATCVSDADCAPGDLCHVFAEGCCSECRTGDQETVLVPECVHAPHLVGAGQPFPLAIFGRTGCAWYDRIEVETIGFDHFVRVVGLTSADPDCPQLNDCDFPERTYLGMIWLAAPNPGTYTVTVSDTHVLTVGASAGIVEPLNCDDDCPAMGMDINPWSLTYHSDEMVDEGCGRHLTQDVPIVFDGSCQEYHAVGSWPYSDWTVQCTDSQIFFGYEAYFYEAEATFCPLSASAQPLYVLGIGRTISAAGEELTRTFLLESR